MNQTLRDSARITVAEMTYFSPKKMYDNPCTLPTYSHHPPRDFEVAMRKLLLVGKGGNPPTSRV